MGYSIIASQLQKTFERQRIVQDFSFQFIEGLYGIQGPNGSGKTTLIKLISGFMLPDSGTLTMLLNNKAISQDSRYSQVAIAAPYVEINNDFTLSESVFFQSKFKKWSAQFDSNDIIEMSGLSKFKNRRVSDFSSGMKQRLKLSLAILSSAPFLFLDEPTTNLDLQGKEWFLNLLNSQKDNRIVIIASNDEIDLAPTEKRIDVRDHR